MNSLSANKRMNLTVQPVTGHAGARAAPLGVPLTHTFDHKGDLQPGLTNA